MKIAKVETLHCDGGWRPVDLRPGRDRRRPRRLGRVQRQPQPLRDRGLRARHGGPAPRAGPAAGRAPVLGHAAAHAPEPRRRDPQGDRGRRAGAVGHQGQGARRARLRAVRRADARSHAPLLVALRHDARAPGRRARHAAAPELRRHRRARQRGRRARLHRAQDQHRHPGRAGDGVLPRLRERHQHHRRRADGRGPRRHRAAHRHVPRRGRARSVGLCLDLNYNFRTEGVLRIAKLLEPFDMQWIEYDNWDPQALLQIKQSTSTRLASCESLVHDPPVPAVPRAARHGRRASSTCRGTASRRRSRSGGWPRPTRSTSRRTTTTATWPTCTRSTSARCCRTCGSWRSTSTTCRGRASWSRGRPSIKDGHICLTDAPGWGADIDEEVLRAHPWPEPARSSVLRDVAGADGGAAAVVAARDAGAAATSTRWRVARRPRR